MNSRPATSATISSGRAATSPKSIDMPTAMKKGP